MLVVVGADNVIPQLAHGVRNQDLFGQTKYEQADALFDLFQAVTIFVYMQLSSHVTVFHDGTCNQLGEHNHIRAEINDIVLSLHIPAVYVDGVAHGLEGVEADTQRQNSSRFHHTDGKPGDRIDGADDEVGVLEEHQHGQAAHNGNDQEDSAHLVRMIEPFDGKAGEIVDEDQHDHHREEAYLTPGIEHQAADEQNQVFQLVRCNVIQRQRDRQKAEQKQNGTEQQACDTPLQKKGRYRRLVIPAKSIVLVGDYFSASSRAVSMAL